MARDKNPIRTGDQTLVREINLSVIMHHLHKHAPISRAALAEMTGLNKTTVSSLVNELIDIEFIHEVGYDSSGIGRPAVLLDLNPQAGHIIATEIGVDFITTVRTNFAAEILWRHHETISEELGVQPILERVIKAIEAAFKGDEHTAGSKVFGVAVGVPGLVDQESGDLLFAPNLGWRSVPVKAALSEAFPTTLLFVDNEANMAALGEYFFGAAAGHNEVLYISVGVGLGGSIVRDGLIFKGKTGFAGEFGHMTVDPDGKLCNCGNRGCWETIVGQRTLLGKIREAIMRGEPSLLASSEFDLRQLTLQQVADAAQQGDELSLRVLERAGADLGTGIASLVNALNPDLVVFGGILSAGADFVLPAINAELEQRALRWNREATSVVLAKHRSDACVIGGVATVFQQIITQPVSMAQYMAGEASAS